MSASVFATQFGPCSRGDYGIESRRFVRCRAVLVDREFGLRPDHGHQRRARLDRSESGGVSRRSDEDLVVGRSRLPGAAEQRAATSPVEGRRLQRRGRRGRDSHRVHRHLGIGEARDRHHWRVRRAAGLVAGGGTQSPRPPARGTRPWLRTPSVRHRFHRSGHCGERLARGQQALRHVAVLRHARRGGRLGQGLHAARGSVRRRGRRGDDASRRPQRVERVEHAGERHRQVPVPRPVRACLHRSRSRTVGARRR